MRRAILVSALLCATGAGLQAQNIAGDWQGTLRFGIGEIRIVVHISDDGAGGLKAAFDSPDQGATGLKVAPIVLLHSRLGFDVGEIGGSYQGTVNAAGTAITGTWKQKLEFPLDFQRVTAPLKTVHKPAPPSDIDGAWSGTLDTGASTIHLIFHIVNTEDGLTATMDSPDQGAKGMPATSAARHDSALRLEMKQIGGGFDGTISADLSTIDGKWTQGGGSLPLVLKR